MSSFESQVGKKRIFNSSTSLYNWIKRVERTAFIETSGAVAILLFFGFLIYKNSGNNLGWLIIGVAGLSVYMGLMIYGSTFLRAKILSHTIDRLILEDESIYLETFQYNMIGLKFFPRKKLKLNRNSVWITDSNFPILDKKNLSGKAIRIIQKEGDHTFFIIPEYFEDELSKEIYIA